MTLSLPDTFVCFNNIKAVKISSARYYIVLLISVVLLALPMASSRATWLMISTTLNGTIKKWDQDGALHPKVTNILMNSIISTKLEF